MKLIPGYKNALGRSRPYTGRYGAMSADDSDNLDVTAAEALENASNIAGAVPDKDYDAEDDGSDVAHQRTSNMPSRDGNGGDDDKGNDNGGSIPPEYLGDPIFLSADTTIASQSSLVTPNQESLRNPYPCIIEICEIRFMLTSELSTNNATVNTNTYNSPAGNIGVVLSIGGEQLTQSANGIPVNLLCPGQKLNSESVAYGSVEFGTTTPAAFVGSYSLILKTPIKVLPNELLEVQLGSLSILNAAVDVRVSYLGRVRPDLPFPAERVLPYFASFNADAIFQPASGNAPTTVQSREVDLQNVFQQSIRINRFVGRINSFFYSPAVGITPGGGGGSSSFPGSLFTEFTDSAVSGQVGYNPTLVPGSDKVLIGMTKSTGTPTIAPGTPFRLAFDAFTRAWQVEDVLAPNGYYIAIVEVDPPNATVGLAVAPVYVGIAIHGERTVEVVNESEAA